jgi:hypothetical protein
MAFYAFDISNHCGDQQFFCDAESLISAHMFAMEFATLLDARIKETFDETTTTKVTLVAAFPSFSTGEEGIETYLDTLKEYLGVE